MQKTFTTKSDTETIALGFRLGHRLRGGDFIALTGDLGGGKTQFTKGIAKGLGITETIVSPTFTIERIYGKLHHFDLYRLHNDSEIAAGIQDLVNEGDNVIVVEWPENISDIVPDNNLFVEFKYVDENTREIVLNYSHPEWERRFQELELNNKDEK